MSRACVAASSSLAITDPLVKYHSLVTAGVYRPDPAQHRLAFHLQKLYMRLKDYTPAPEYRSRLRQITHALDSSRKGLTDELAVEGHPIRRNPLFARFFRRTEGEGTLALTRVLTSHQAALDVDSPKGLFLSGGVGTGKSMLLDLLAEGLPTSRKRRWHFNTFMLYAFSRLEQFRKSEEASSVDGREYSLLWLAKEMAEESPILFLDEFQLPDRAASKILNNLFIAFFQLGGVLVASSNRMPEELEKATGSQYSPPSTGGLVKQVLGLGRRNRGELFGQTSDFAAFLEVLRARCDFWHMEGVRDWRRRENESSIVVPRALVEDVVSSAASGSEPSSGVLKNGVEIGSEVHEHDCSEVTKKPAMYCMFQDDDETWQNKVTMCSNGIDSGSAAWKSANLVVYGRNLTIPKQFDGATYWDFGELVGGFGPADYITMASNYKTFIIDNVPVLNMSMKTEARRFITLLDALYEARCKVAVRAVAAPDDLFFPEAKMLFGANARPGGDHLIEPDDATYSETIAEVFQDQMSPFRPNISTYTDSPNAKYNPDQDSDFGGEQHKEINFSNTGAFTGEDERFAYKRASSRLWELCSAQWHARTGDWWHPLPIQARHWEGREASKPLSLHASAPSKRKSEITMGPSTELDEPVGLERFKLASIRERGG